VSTWARYEPQEALTWVRALPEGAGKTNALSNVISNLAATDPKQAASLVSGLPAAAQDNVAAQIAHHWANQDATAAAQWAAALPEGESRTNAFRSIAQSWADQDLIKAAQWLERLPEGKARDGAVSSFAQKVTDADPEGAAAWASTIGETNARNSELERVYRVWTRRDAAAAKSWLSASNVVPADMKGRWLESK
jgi:hypothetical protein